MAAEQSNPLTHADTLTEAEADRLIRERMTDELARASGYPSARVYRMALDLADLAARWRTAPTDDVIRDYHLLYYKLIAFGWDPTTLDFDAALPAEYMPELPERFTAP